MSPKELWDACRPDEPGLLDDFVKHIYLTTTRPSVRNLGRKVRLSGPGSPLGDVCNVKQDADFYVLVACYQRADVRKWMTKNGFSF